MPTDSYTDLVAELNSVSNDAIVAWLQKALAGQESRLPLSRGEPLSIGLARLKDSLNASSRSGVARAAFELLRVAVRREFTEVTIIIETLLFVVSEYVGSNLDDPSALGAYDLMWRTVLTDEVFATAPIPLQTNILNFLEKRPEIVSVESWRQLVTRNPERFGPTAFAALARLNLGEALDILPELPATAPVTTALRMRMRWLISIIPDEQRFAAFRKIGSTLRQVTLSLRVPIQLALVDAGVDVTDLLSVHYDVVLTVLNKPAAPRDALSPLNLEDLFD